MSFTANGTTPFTLHTSRLFELVILSRSLTHLQILVGYLLLPLVEGQNGTMPEFPTIRDPVESEPEPDLTTAK